MSDRLRLIAQAREDASLFGEKRNKYLDLKGGCIGRTCSRRGSKARVVARAQFLQRPHEVIAVQYFASVGILNWNPYRQIAPVSGHMIRSLMMFWVFGFARV